MSNDQFQQFGNVNFTPTNDESGVPSQDINRGGQLVDVPANEGSSISWSIDGKPVSGIEILVQMAGKNEIDPKNIDVIDVADRFLKTIAAAPKENLRQSGRILFHASVLLRMKAEALLSFQEEADLYGDDFLEFDEFGNPLTGGSEKAPRQITLQDLEKAIVRRSFNKSMRHRPVTLEDLIEALRTAERADHERAHRVVEPKIDLSGHHQIDDVGDILDLAAEEDIDAVIERVEAILRNTFSSDDFISLMQLIQCLGGGGDWVDAFLAILFLANAGKIDITQEEFYGPVMLSAGTALPLEVATETPA
jgi:segregation and condensation protein A